MAVWAIYVRQIRMLSVPRRPAGQIGACVAAVVLAGLALASDPGIVGVVLACVAMGASLRFLLTTLTSRLPGTMPAAQVGEPAPVFTATDASGNPFDLGSLRGRAVLLKFFRGHASPHCLAELRRWEAFRGQLDLFGVSMVAVSPDDVAQAARLRSKNQLGITLLTDDDFQLTNMYKVRQERLLAAAGLPVRPRVIPTTFLIDSDGVVRWIDQAEDYRIRSDIDRVMAAVKLGLARQARELRESS